MDLDEKAYWLALSGAPGIGPRRFNKLLEVFGSAREVWEGSLPALSTVLGRSPAEELADYRKRVEPRKVWDALVETGYKTFFSCEECYPKLLREISDSPPVLYYLGEYRPEDQLAVAVVGARSATPGGLILAESLAKDLAAQGVTVVSGLARGIDSAAHRGALMVNGGRTIAVLGNGLDQVYPPENKELMEEISRRGMICTEFPPGTKPLAQNFPARNRIISGLSLGVTVVEAAEDSGSLITAGFALEQGRDVFAVPGPIDRRVSKGANRLIKQGARLIEGAEDILTVLNLPFVSEQELAAADSDAGGLTPAEKRLRDLLAEGEAHVDILVRDSGLPASEVGAALATMELKGTVSRIASNIYRLVKK